MAIGFGYFRPIRASIILGLSCALLAGCGRGGENANQSSQVVARIGSEVVTPQELDNEFRILNVPTDKRKDPDTVKKVLGDIVTRKYLARQAVNDKLDREPATLLDILRARELVLAGAAMTRTVNAKVASVSKADVDKYIASNPAKFANRELLNVEQITIPPVANLQSIIDATRDLHSLDEVESKLTELGIPHGRSQGVLNSAETPDNIVSALKAQKADDVLFTRSGQNGVFLKVRSHETQPVEGEAAANLARQLMRMDALKSEASMAAFSANVEAKYEGEYASIMGKTGESKQQ